jgi:hypothetical protein
MQRMNEGEDLEERWRIEPSTTLKLSDAPAERGRTLSLLVFVFILLLGLYCFCCGGLCGFMAVRPRLCSVPLVKGKRNVRDKGNT